jgi:ABC-type protease/lipase transport system fused ATPase/permease subunit
LENVAEFGVVVAVVLVPLVWLSKLPFRISWAEAVEAKSAAMALEMSERRRKAEVIVCMVFI